MTGPPPSGYSSPRRDTYLGLRPSEWAIGATSASLNVLLNGVLPPRLHTPAGLAAAALVGVLAAKEGASQQDQGLRPADMPRGLAYGLAAAAPIAAAAGAGACFGRSRVLYEERRITEVTARRAAYEVLVRIPLGTALPEEVIFRGALLGVLTQHHRRFVAAMVSSLLFGLWHVAPSLARMETLAVVRGRPYSHRVAWLAGTVLITSVAGLALTWLRYRSRSIVAPWMAHCAANAMGFAAGWTVARLTPPARLAPAAGTAA